MAINKITGKSIKDVDISASDLAPGTITDAKIATGTITNAKLAGSIANAKLSNSNITINGTAINLGASGEIVAGTDWQAVTVADGSTTLAAEAGKGYFLDTNAGVIEVFLPTSPSRGDTVVLVDYAGHFNLNNCIVNTGTRNLDSTTTRQYKITANDSIAELVYVDAAKGWITKMNQAAGTTPGTVYNAQGGYDTLPPEIQATGGTVTTTGDYKIHTFTGDGNFVVGQISTTSANNTVSYVVIAGGGGTGSSGGNSAGGGGGGGYREGRNQPVDGYTASPLVANSPTNAVTVSQGTTYPITVGGGGAGSCASSAPEQPGTAGSNSVFSTITSAGGGFGAGTQNPGVGGNGGSGGGGGGGGYNRSGGTGNTPPVSPAQGTNGGSSPPSGGDTNGGGGGGAGQAGQTASGSASGGGGDGVTSSITGSSVARGGGGAGGAYTPGGDSMGSAGTGGGGGSNANAKGDDGTANTGGGGGGPSNTSTANGSAGGKGVVIIRYKYQ